MPDAIDLLVLGAGPAGAAAALAAAEHGARTVMVDEALAPGGQVYRAPPTDHRQLGQRALEPEHRDGEALRRRLQCSGVEVATRHRVWSLLPGFRVHAIGPAGHRAWVARAVVLATGTTERVVPFPGWTTPGVIGLAAATILLKSQGAVPGERVVVAGCGPLLAAVGAGLVKAGRAPVAVVDLAGRGEWLRALPAMAARPDLVRRGLGWLAALRRAGVPLLSGHGVVAVEGDTRVTAVRIAPVASDGTPRAERVARRLEADALVIGHGLVPATEATRLLEADHRFVADAGGWIPVLDDDCATSVAGLFAAGDGSGLAGAAAARLQGEIAGLAAARHLGQLDEGRYQHTVAPLRQGLARARRFGQAMARLTAPRPAMVGTIAADTVVCRCEDVTRAEIETAIASGAREMNQLKAWTRCGMGPCQGRMCAETAASLLARHVGGREAAGQWTARAPLRPLPLADMVGEFGYDDIPMPEPAPP